MQKELAYKLTAEGRVRLSESPIACTAGQSCLMQVCSSVNLPKSWFSRSRAVQFQAALRAWQQALSIVQDSAAKSELLIGRSQCYLGVLSSYHATCTDYGQPDPVMMPL